MDRWGLPCLDMRRWRPGGYVVGMERRNDGRDTWRGGAETDRYGIGIFLGRRKKEFKDFPELGQKGLERGRDVGNEIFSSPRIGVAVEKRGCGFGIGETGRGAKIGWVAEGEGRGIGEGGEEMGTRFVRQLATLRVTTRLIALLASIFLQRVIPDPRPID